MKSFGVLAPIVQHRQPLSTPSFVFVTTVFERITTMTEPNEKKAKMCTKSIPLEDTVTDQQQVTKHEHGACVGKEQESQQTTSPQYVGFDAVVREERKARKLTFGPNSKKVIKPSNVLIDIYGVICSWDFVKTLRQFALENIAEYMRECWNDKAMKVIMARIREQVTIDRKVDDQLPDIAPASAALEDQIASACISVRWQLDKKHKTTKVGSVAK